MKVKVEDNDISLNMDRCLTRVLKSGREGGVQGRSESEEEGEREDSLDDELSEGVEGCFLVRVEKNTIQS